jgi:hypothetical protein
VDFHLDEFYSLANHGICHAKLLSVDDELDFKDSSMFCRRHWESAGKKVTKFGPDFTQPDGRNVL